MVWEGHEDRRDASRGEEPTLGGHLPTALALNLAVWPSGWGGRKKSATVPASESSLFDPSVEEQGLLPGRVPWQCLGLGRRLARNHSRAFVNSLGKAILNIQTSVHREPLFPTK